MPYNPDGGVTALQSCEWAGRGKYGGATGDFMIITLPGSPKGVRECLEVVNPVLPHALELLKQETVSEHPR